MIRHVVLYYLKDKSPESKQALANQFLSMKGKIPYLKSITSGADFLDSERSYDVVRNSLKMRVSTCIFVLLSSNL